MRHIILGLSLLIALPQQIKPIDSNDFFWTTVIIVGLYRLADSIYKSSDEQKRENDLLQESLNKKILTSRIDPIQYLKTLKLSIQTNTAALETLTRLPKNDPSLQQEYYALQKKNILLEREVFNSLHSMQQLSNEQLQQISFLQQYNITQEDLELLVVLKQKNYRGIPRNIVDEVTKNYIKLEKKLPTQPA